MYDTALNDQFPAGAAAYAAYVDGGIGDQPNYAYIVSAFPKAQHLSIALFASNNADALDVEPGAASPSDIPGWFARQVARGIQRPVIYASASTMNDTILPLLSQAGTPVRTRGCGQRTTGLASISAARRPAARSASRRTARSGPQALRASSWISRCLPPTSSRPPRTRPSWRRNCSQASSTWATGYSP